MGLCLGAPSSWRFPSCPFHRFPSGQTAMETALSLFASLVATCSDVKLAPDAPEVLDRRFSDLLATLTASAGKI
jgi:hypothetical protein